LDADPTADIRNSDKIYRVMLGGRLYDPVTMDEVVTGTRKRAPYWWQDTASMGVGSVTAAGHGDTGGD
ncbi:MAG TPA: hypothetical protein VNT42_11645, partial [Sphingomonas sp.]|nr:hypothetical protein [Sphingomonas sp.]